MNQNDQKLISKANQCSYLDYQDIGSMIEQAESKEARDILERRRSFLYHMEEYHSGLL